MSVAVITDSNSGISQADAKAAGFYVIPMPFYINDELYYEEITMSQKEFYEHLENGSDVHTSQPSPADTMELWDKLLKEYDEIIHIPMSSSLSSTCETAIMLSRDGDYNGRVFVVDNQRISITQRQATYEAKKLADAGISGKAIKEVLERTKADSGIYIAVQTMEYLKKGGRVTPAAAGIATILNIKPVLQIQGGKLDQYAKVRGMKAAKKEIFKAIHNDLNGRFKQFADQGKMQLAIAYSGDDSEVREFQKEVEAEFSGYTGIFADPLSLSVSCHIGPGSLAMACTRIIDADDV